VYDFARIDVRRVMMKQLRNGGHIKMLAHCMRQDLLKNIGNISDTRLYNQCHFGTKRSIEKYIEEVIKGIKAIYDADAS
jgi:TAG lipase / steryl ester hydrolase / phospholipase A2 / LPA acyltransferase